MVATRRLAAILAADVAGYSRLIGADEEGTLLRLKAVRAELIDPMIAEHKGRIVKTTGDGLLVEFASVVDALRCAVEVQREMAGRNVGVPEDRRLDFRIGIHQGDIVVEDGDIFGDGVNVAARLEGLAEPGGICVSARVQEDAAGRLDVTFEDIGDQSLKNIARPVRAYRVAIASTAVRAPLPLPDKPSLAVLPFQNLSGDPEQEYFVDGVVEEIITTISRLPWLFVIARNSSFAYKGKSPDLRQVGRELGVRYVLEGSLRALWMGGWAIAVLAGERAAGLSAIKRALELNPNCALAWNFSGWVRGFSNCPGPAIEAFERAMRLSPLDPQRWAFEGGLAQAHLFAGRYEDAIKWADQALQENPRAMAVLRFKADACGQLGRVQEGHECVRRLRELVPGSTIASIREDARNALAPEVLALHIDGLRKAGLPEE